MHPYTSRKNELLVLDGCALWGSRVIVPPAGHSKVLEELHDGHPGISRMKGLARSLVWWPGTDKDVDEKVKRCQQCQENLNSPAKALLHPLEWPRRPWTRIHVDHAGTFCGRMFLVVVNSCSKWLEVMIVPSATSQNMIQRFRSVFATHGLLEILVYDNGIYHCRVSRVSNMQWD